MTWDVDGNGQFDALTDGKLILGYLFGLTGEALIRNSIAPDATRREAAEIIAYLESIRDELDVDGNGIIDALTDAILYLRHLFGFTGDALTRGAVGAGATRDAAEQIVAYLEAIANPPPIEPEPVPIDLEADLGLVEEPVPVGNGVFFLGEGIPADELTIDVPTNVNAADTTNADQLWSGGGLGLNLDGNGLTVGVWEATERRTLRGRETNSWRIRDTHEALNGRVTIVDDGTSFSDHATHVAGTIGAVGVNPQARGMANRINLRSYSAGNDRNEMESDASLIAVSNHSYGQVAGWWIGSRDTENAGEVIADVWWGDYSISSTEDANFGKYKRRGQELDEVLFDNPNLLSVWSASNDRLDRFRNYSSNDTFVIDFRSDPGITDLNWTGGGWYQVPTDVVRPPGEDGNEGTGYDSLPPAQVAKNTLVVGAIEDITDDPYRDASITFFSSWGPTDDGRIKPDVVGNGNSLLSSGSESDTDYYESSGTSMAAPNVTGTAALLIQHYNNLFGSSPRSATTKGLLIHTAFDAGRIGPDYSYGWGVVDGAAAANLLTNTDSSNPSILLEEGSYTGTELTFEVFSDGSGPIKATIVWTDPPGEVQSQNTLDDRTPVLVNNLDLWITDSNDNIFYPWTLNPAVPNEPAQRVQFNAVDNVEQVVIDAPAAGSYTIHIGNQTGDIFTQDYSLLVSTMEEEDSSSTRDLGTLAGRSQYTDFVGSDNTSDYYRFNLDAPGRLEFAIRELSANADVELLDSSNQVLISSVNEGNISEFASIDNLSPGDYAVRVYSASGETDYELTLNLDLAGNSRDNARDLGTLTDRSELGDYEFRDFVGATLGDEADYYRFRLDRDRVFIFALREMSANADVYLEDANGNILQSSTLSDNAHEIAEANLAANTNYYIRVEPFEENSTNYLLVLNPGEEESPEPPEPPDNDESQDLGTLTGRSQYTNFVGSGNTSDYYRFNLEAPGRLEFAIRELTADANMELLNSSNQVLETFVDESTNEKYARIDDLSPGNYSVRVYSASGDTDYELTLNLDLAGNSRDNARDLGTLTDRSELGDYQFRDFVGRLLGDEVDYYRFQLDRSRLFTFALRELSADADIYLEDANGNILERSINSGTEDEIDDENLAANTTYYIRVNPFNDDSTNYQLVLNPREEINQEPPDPEPPDNDENQDLGTLTGRSQYTDFVGSGNTSDYYRFNLDAVGRLEFAIRELSADADMELLNSSNQVIASSVNGGTSDEFASIDNLSPGNYTVRVYSASGDTDYQLTLNLDKAGNSRNNARDLGTLTDRSELGDYQFRDFVGATLGDEFDYYRFRLDRARVFIFALREMSANADVYLEDANGNILQSSTLSGNAHEIAEANLAANTTYYIRVDPFQSDSTNYLLVLNPREEANSSFSFQLDNQAVTQDAATYVPLTNTSVLAGTSDDDTLIGRAGAGVINGRPGDDLIGISDRSFGQISGGSGEDTLRLDGTFNLDLTAIDDTRIQGIEILDLNGGGNSLTLEVRDLQNISEEENSLTVLGTAGNAVNANLPGFSTNSADGFTTYTDGTSSLVVDDNLIQNVLT